MAAPAQQIPDDFPLGMFAKQGGEQSSVHSLRLGPVVLGHHGKLRGNPGHCQQLREVLDLNYSMGDEFWGQMYQQLTS